MANNIFFPKKCISLQSDWLYLLIYDTIDVDKLILQSFVAITYTANHKYKNP